MTRRGRKRNARAKREPNGQPSRAELRNRHDLDRVGPTPELIKRLAENGPTCPIQRLALREAVSSQEAQALSAYAGLLARAHLLGDRIASELGDLQPKDRTRPREWLDERRAAAVGKLKDLWWEMDGDEVRHVGRMLRRQDFDLARVKSGAGTLVRLLMNGEMR